MPIRCFAIACLAVAIASTPALAGEISFDDAGFVHGEIIDTDFLASDGLKISADVKGVSPDLAIIFDSNTKVATTDRDLLFGGAWAGGNATKEDLGNLLILSENTRTKPGDPDVILDPDDEGSRPAGSITFDFGATYWTALGLSLVDFEEYKTSSIDFYNGGAKFRTITFDEFSAGGAFDNGATWGDRFANRIDPLDPGAAFNKFVVNYGGSGAIGDIVVVPLPAAAWMGILGLGILGIARHRRRRAI